MAATPDTTPLDPYSEPPAADITNLVQSIAGSAPGGKTLSSIQNALRKHPQAVNPAAMLHNNLLFHRISAALSVGPNPVTDDVQVRATDPQLVEPHGRGSPLRPSGISLFIPLAGPQVWKYAHQQMLSRFGNTCFTHADPTITGSYFVVDNLAIRSDNVFGLHVTMSVNDQDQVRLTDLHDVAQCRAPQGWLPCCIRGNAEALIQRPHIDDLDPNLILHLLDLVAKHCPNPRDCFMAAYYSFVFAEFLHANPDYFTEDDEDDNDEQESKFGRMLRFGGDDVILSLVVKASEHLAESKATTSNYFTLEMILSVAKHMLDGVEVVVKK